MHKTDELRPEGLREDDLLTISCSINRDPSSVENSVVQDQPLPLVPELLRVCRQDTNLIPGWLVLTLLPQSHDEADVRIVELTTTQLLASPDDWTSDLTAPLLCVS